MYNQDSFFTLTIPGQVGLLGLSLVLFGALIWGMTCIRAAWYLKLVIAVVGFFCFAWFSPQVYYTYYLLLFDGLPIQLVIGSPPSINDIFRLMTFRGQQNLSSHGQGILAWGMIISGQLSQFSHRRRNAAN